MEFMSFEPVQISTRHDLLGNIRFNNHTTFLPRLRLSSMLFVGYVCEVNEFCVSLLFYFKTTIAMFCVCFFKQINEKLFYQ